MTDFRVHGLNIMKSSESSEALAYPNGAAVTVYDAYGRKVSGTHVDEEGCFGVTFPREGKYTIEVGGTCDYRINGGSYVEEDAPVVPCRCIVTVKAGSADAKAAKAVEDAIAALPAVDELTLDDREAVEAARAAFDALTDTQKALVSNEDALKAAEEKIAELNQPDNPFVDVTEKDYFYDAVLWAVAEDITKGTDATHFSPSGNCTRAQVANFLWRAAGMPEPESAVNPFSDVKADAYYYKAVLWAVENEITTGTGNGKFSPNSNCSRGQVVTFLWRAAGSPEPTAKANPFKDVREGDYYCKAVLWAVEEGITKGTLPTAFSPDMTCSRGQVVTFLFRASSAAS